MLIKKLIRFCFLIIISNNVLAFETHTHAYISDKAYNLSDLGNANSTTLLQRLGLSRLSADTPFQPYWVSATAPLNGYYDNLADGSMPLDYLRRPDNYEFKEMYVLQILNKITQDTAYTAVGSFILPIRNWLLRGAIREDDLTPGYYNDEPPPDPDPRGPILRSLRHFYDPINNKGLMGVNQRSVDWALGTADVFQSLSPDSNRDNHFSWADARENYYLALTARRDANNNGFYDASERQADTKERLFRWATLFRCLGDVIHLLQDTAQPQHTRDDRHNPEFNADERQAFEPFTNARLLKNAETIGGNNPSGGDMYVRSLANTQLASYFTDLPGPADYPPPSFATPLGFFTTRQPGDSPATSPDGRQGLADYSNRGFFTSGTLPNLTSYPRPVTTITTQNGYVRETLPCSEMPALQGHRPISCARYTHTVPDSVMSGRTDATTAVPMVAEGSWFDAINLYRIPVKGYSMSPEIFKTQGDLIIPRAIAYSAGLINYFFRGQLAVKAPQSNTSPQPGLISIVDFSTPHHVDADKLPRLDSNNAIFGFTKVELQVQNTSDYRGARESMGRGTLVAVASYHRNLCYQPNLSGEIAYSPSSQNIVYPSGCTLADQRSTWQERSVSAASPIAGTIDAQPQPVSFDFRNDPIPINATDLFIQVVYRGFLGDEPNAVAVRTLDVGEPFHYAWFNQSDYYRFQNAWRRPADIRNDPMLQGADIDPEDIVNLTGYINNIPLVTASGISPGRYVQVAMLGADTAINFRTDWAFQRTGAIASSIRNGLPLNSWQRQATTEAGNGENLQLVAGYRNPRK